MAHLTVMTSPVDLRALCLCLRCISEGWDSRKVSKGERWGRGVLTRSCSSGRSLPLLMPRFMVTKRSKGGLSRTLGLCRPVLSMMTEKDST